MRIKIFGVLVLTLEPPVSQSACSLGPSRCPPRTGKWSSRWRPSSPSRCTSRPSWAPWRRLAVWSPAVEPSRCLQHSCLSPLPRTRSQEYICSQRPPQQSWLRHEVEPVTVTQRGPHSCLWFLKYHDWSVFGIKKCCSNLKSDLRQSEFCGF